MQDITETSVLYCCRALNSLYDKGYLSEKLVDITPSGYHDLEYAEAYGVKPTDDEILTFCEQSGFFSEDCVNAGVEIIKAYRDGDLD